MNGADEDGWSSVAGEWARLWGGFADPARQAIIAACDIGPGTRVLDVGCGSGEFLKQVRQVGATASGVDPAPGMLAHADGDVRLGSFDHLPWPDGSFDVVTAFNALQFAADPVEALREAARVTTPGGLVAVSNWAEGPRNDLDVIEAAVAEADGEGQLPDGELWPEGGLAAVFGRSGLELVTAGLVETPWTAPDEETLVRGVLLGEDDATMVETASVVITAARPFKLCGGGYRLSNAFRYAVGRVPADYGTSRM